MLQLTSRRFLRELDEAPGGNNLQYILKYPCIPFFGNQGLHNKIMLGGNRGRSGVMCEGFPYRGSVFSGKMNDNLILDQLHSRGQLLVSMNTCLEYLYN